MLVLVLQGRILVQPREVVTQKTLSLVRQDVEVSVHVVDVLDIANPVHIVKVYFLAPPNIYKEGVSRCCNNAGGLEFVEDEEFGLVVEVS